MTENLIVVSTTDASDRKFPLARRALLFAAIVGLGIPALFGGPIAYQEYGSPAQAASLETMARPVGFSDIVARVRPAVISVRVKIVGAAEPAQDDKDNNVAPSQQGSLNELFRGGPNTSSGMPQGREIVIGQGSGFFISADGYAVTNNHVVDEAETVDVRTNDGTVYHAKVIGTDQKTDLALIKVDGGGNFPHVRFANTPPRAGDWALAVGNPFGLGGTVTAGIVSASGRDIGEGPYDDFIQIDAPINKGNSGGPTFDIDGNVMGVNTAIYSPSGGSVGIGFAVPADTAKAVIEELRDKGYVIRGWIGVQVQPVDSDIADSLGLKKAEGALIDESQPGSPAAKAGVVGGDVVTAIDGAALKDSREFARKISSMAPGRIVKLSVLQNGREKVIPVRLGEMPNDRKASAGTDETATGATDGPQLGLGLAPADNVAGAGAKGVVVTVVDPAGSAAEHGLQPGDVILEIDSKEVSKASDVRGALSRAASEGKHAVLMHVKSGASTMYVALPLSRY